MAAMGASSVFISYRRKLSWPLASLVRKDLIEHGFDTFMDVENLDSGEFPREILSQIDAREHFIVLLQPGSLNRIGKRGDWLREEIGFALLTDRNVVPVTADGFSLFSRGVKLPPDVARLPSFNAVSIEPGYFDAAMERLRTRFLKRPPKALPLPKLPAPVLAGRHGERSRIELTWSEVSGADEYLLEGSGPPIGSGIGSLQPFREIYRGPNRSYEGAPGSPGKWTFRVCANPSWRVGESGEWSNWVWVDWS